MDRRRYFPKLTQNSRHVQTPINLRGKYRRNLKNGIGQVLISLAVNIPRTFVKPILEIMQGHLSVGTFEQSSFEFWEIKHEPRPSQYTPLPGTLVCDLLERKPAWENSTG